MLRRWGGIRTSAVVVETHSHGAGGFAFDHRMLQKLLVIMGGTVSAIMRAARTAYLGENSLIRRPRAAQVKFCRQ